jgi:hypothetical protein
MQDTIKLNTSPAIQNPTFAPGAWLNRRLVPCVIAVAIEQQLWSLEATVGVSLLYRTVSEAAASLMTEVSDYGSSRYCLMM